MNLLSEQDISEALQSLQGWEYQEKSIVKSFEFNKLSKRYCEILEHIILARIYNPTSKRNTEKFYQMTLV